MLAVVQHNKQIPVPDGPCERLHDGAARLVWEAKRPGRRDGHDVRICDRRQVDVARAVTKAGRQARRHLDGEPGLSRAARADERHQPVLVQQPRHVGHLRLAADETRQLHRKIVRTNGFGGTQGREVVAKIGMT